MPAGWSQTTAAAARRITAIPIAPLSNGHVGWQGSEKCAPQPTHSWLWSKRSERVVGAAFLISVGEFSPVSCRTTQSYRKRSRQRYSKSCQVCQSLDLFLYAV